MKNRAMPLLAASLLTACGLETDPATTGRELSTLDLGATPTRIAQPSVLRARMQDGIYRAAPALPSTARTTPVGDRPEALCSPQKDPAVLLGVDPWDGLFVPSEETPVRFSLPKTDRIYVAARLHEVCGYHSGTWEVLRPDGSLHLQQGVSFVALGEGKNVRRAGDDFVVVETVPMIDLARTNPSALLGTWTVRFSLRTDPRVHAATTFELF